MLNCVNLEPGVHLKMGGIGFFFEPKFYGSSPGGIVIQRRDSPARPVAVLDTPANFLK